MNISVFAPMHRLPAGMAGLDETALMPLEAEEPVRRAAPLADVVIATRSFLNAWDRAMSSWRANPMQPARLDDAVTPSGFDRAYFMPTRSPGGMSVGYQPTREEPWSGGAVSGLAARAGADDPVTTSIAHTHGLTAQMLDGFQVWLDGQPVQELPRGKARALLQVLLLQRRRPISRARLCALFWPDADAASARNSLNVTLHRLRRALGKVNLLRHSDEGYQLFVQGEVWLDVEHFMLNAELGRGEETMGHSGAAITHYEAALALYRADLLDAGDYEPALAGESQALRDRFNEVLERLATLREQVGDLHGCLRVTLRHLTQDECNEGAHQRLMRCYARLGQPQLAERQYRSCVTALRLQLGLHPSDDTTALCRRIGRREQV
jgi:DNA-binding SARP family transcriptional activator